MVETKYVTSAIEPAAESIIVNLNRPSTLPNEANFINDKHYSNWGKISIMV